MCGYTSIQDVAKNLVGDFVGSIVADRFRNIDLIDKVDCPIFIVHG